MKSPEAHHIEQMKQLRAAISRLITLQRRSLSLCEQSIKCSGQHKAWTKCATQRDEQYKKVREIAAAALNLKKYL